MDKSGDVDLQIKGEETTSINQVLIEKEIPYDIVEDMVGAIIDGRSVMADGEEGRKSVAIFTSLYESSRTGQVVYL